MSKITIVMGSNGVPLRVDGLPDEWTWDVDYEKVFCPTCGKPVESDGAVDEDEFGWVHYGCNRDWEE